MNKFDIDFLEILKSKSYRKHLFLTAISIFFIQLLLVYGLIQNNKRVSTLVEYEQKRDFNKAYSAVVEHYQSLSNLMLDEFIINDYILEKIYTAQKYKGKITSEFYEKIKDEKRAEIYEELKDTYKEMTDKYEIRQFHFHLPNAISFLRFHSPTKYGDDLSKVRYSIVQVNETKKSVSGFEGGKIFNGYRYVKPLFYKNEFIGTVEISIGFEAIHKWLEKIYNGHIYMILKKSALDKKLFDVEKNKNGKSYINDEYYHENYMVEKIVKHCFSEEHQNMHKKSHTEYHLSLQEFSAINNKLKKEFLGKVLPDKEFVKWVETKNGNYIAVTFKPLRNLKKEHVGFLINYMQSNDYKKHKSQFYVAFIISIIVALSIFMFIMYIFYQREKEAIKSKKLERIVKELQYAKTQISGKQLELMAINADLEARVERTVAEAREKDKIMLQQSRLASMGEMIGNIAHQWRQPLNALALQIQDMEDAYEFDEIDEHYIKALVEKSMKKINFMSKTIDDFRNFFEPNKTIERFNVVSSVDQVLDMITPSFLNHSINVEFEKDKDEYFCMGYPNEFKQVVLNILNNAKDAFIDHIDSSEPVVEPKVKISIEDKGDTNIIYISDNAKGIPENVIDRIFEPYFTTKEEGKGTGVGLYMSKMIIEENMQGRLSVKNENDGAVFIIELKAASD